MFRRTRYQQGMLSRVKRKHGPDCWAFRWWDIDATVCEFAGRRLLDQSRNIRLRRAR